MTALDFDAINRAALISASSFLAKLIPGGKVQGREYLVRNPRRNDQEPGSFSINYETGQWADFATGDKGGDLISLLAYVRGIGQGDAARELAGMIAYPMRQNGYTTRLRDAQGKPRFVANDDGPSVTLKELRRLVYRRDGAPCRIKIKLADGRFANWYRVADASGVMGWQNAKPSGYIDVPYVTEGANPFDREVASDPLCWCEGEKDADNVTRIGLPAFTFGGVGDGLPAIAAEYIAGRQVVILADNDDAGRKHAQAKAKFAYGKAVSIRIVEFPQLASKGDVSDWIAQGHGANELEALADTAPLWAPPNDNNQAHSSTPRSLISHRASDLAPEKIEWLWPGRIAVGKLTLIGGKPGVGKSQVTSKVAACVSHGAPWPCDEGSAPRGSVVIFSAEDGLRDTIVPRLMAAGADTTRVVVISGVTNSRSRTTFDLKADVDLLEEAVRKIGDVKLIIIDPVSAYMGQADGHNNVETRGVLEPIAEMADRLRIAVIAVTHLNKGGAGNQGVLERFTGSIAFIAAARAGFVVIPDQENENRFLFLSVKNNLAPTPKGLAFRCLQTIVGNGIVAPYIEWQDDYVPQSADDALSAIEIGAEGKGGSAKEQAIDFLQPLLAAGPMLVKDIEREAVAACLLEEGKPIGQSKPFRDARKALGVISKKDGFGPGAPYRWGLPDTAWVPASPMDASAQDGASMEDKGIHDETRGDLLDDLEIPPFLRRNGVASK